MPEVGFPSQNTSVVQQGGVQVSLDGFPLCGNDRGFQDWELCVRKCRLLRGAFDRMSPNNEVRMIKHCRSMWECID